MKRLTAVVVSVFMVILIAGCKPASNLETSSEDITSDTVSAVTEDLKIAVDLNETEQSILNPYDFPVGEQPYFIYVEKKSHTLTIFKKNEAGYYADIVGRYLTATGKGMSMTPTGVFTITEKMKWFRWPSGNYSPYACKYYPNSHYGGLFIHGPVYFGKNFGAPCMSTVYSIGKSSSSGCMRTSVEAAYFVYKNCEVGTMIKIVNGSPFATTAPPVKINLQFSDPAKNPDAFEYFSGSSTIEFEDENIYVNEGETVSIIPKSIDNYTSSSFQWTSSNTDVAEIHNGYVEAKSPGTTRVTVVSLATGSSDSVTVKVKVNKNNKKKVNTAENDSKLDFNADENNVNLTLNDLKMQYNGKQFAVDENMNSIFPIFGYNFNFSQAPSCAYKGYDKFFSYSFEDETNIDFSTVPIGGIDTVCEVYSTSPEVSTAKGIKPGSTEKELKKAYGTDCTVEYVSEYDADDGYYVVTYWIGEKNNQLTPRIYFLLDSNGEKVTAIAMSSAKNMG